MESFEYAHVAIFFVAMIYTIQAAVIAGITIPVKRMWRACDEQDKEYFVPNECRHCVRQTEKGFRVQVYVIVQVLGPPAPQSG